MKRSVLSILCCVGLLAFPWADAFATNPLGLFQAIRADMETKRIAEKKLAPPDKCCLCVPSITLKPAQHEISISTCSCKVCEDQKAENTPHLIRVTKQKNGQLLVRFASNSKHIHSVFQRCIRDKKPFIYREFDNRPPLISCEE